MASLQCLATIIQLRLKMQQMAPLCLSDISDIYSVCRVMKVAKNFLDQGKTLSFAVANKNLFSHDVSELGLDSSSGELPVVGIRTTKGDKYAMQEDFT